MVRMRTTVIYIAEPMRMPAMMLLLMPDCQWHAKKTSRQPVIHRANRSVCCWATNTLTYQ